MTAILKSEYSKFMRVFNIKYLSWEKNLLKKTFKNPQFAVLLTGLFLFLGIIFFPKTTKAEIATRKDWIGLFEVGAPNDQAVEKKYVSCSPTPGNPMLANPAGCNFSPPDPGGPYEIRMFGNDSNDPNALIAKSNPFTVATPCFNQ